MKQRHRYEYNIDINGPTAPAAVARMVGKDKRVLEIGAGPGSIARLLNGYGGCRVTAIELDEEAIKKLSPFCERVYRCDLNDQAWNSVLPQDGNKFEVVVAADVLEHLYDPWSTLMSIKELVDQDGYIVVSLPHIGHSAAIACLFQTDMKYQESGLLDKTHIRFFGIESMQRLFNDAGFKIVEVEFIVLPPEQTELMDYWLGIPAELKQDLACNRFGMVYQVVVKAKPDSLHEQGLKLSSLPVPAPGLARFSHATVSTKFVYSIKANILPHLSYRMRSRIRNILYKVGLRF